MKLLVCDSVRISTFDLPSKVEDFFMINYYYSNNNVSIMETLTLEANDGYWNLLTDDSLRVKQNNVYLERVVLRENLFYKINFSDIEENIYIYVLGKSDKYIDYSVSDVNNIVIGNSENATIFCDDNSLLEQQVIIYLKDNNYYIKTLENSNVYVYLNGLTFYDDKLMTGDVIFLNGLKIIWMGIFLKINQIQGRVRPVKLINFSDDRVNNSYSKVSDFEKSVKLFKENDVFFHTPRLKSDLEKYFVTIELPPPPYNEERMPVILTIGSSIMFGLISCVTGVSAIAGLINGTTDVASAIVELIICFLMIISSIVFPIVTDLWDKNRQKKLEKLRQEKYREYLDKNVNIINDYVKEQESILKENNLDLNTIANDIINNSKRIWNRNLFDDDFLSLTFGIGMVPAQIEINLPTEGFSMTDDDLKDLIYTKFSKKIMLNDVPVSISAIENSVLPILLNTSHNRDFIVSLMLQLIYYHSGKDLKIVVFTNKTNEDRWDYLKYLSHCWNSKFDKRFFATTDNEMAEISLFLEGIYDERLKSFNTEESNNIDGEHMYLNFSEYYLVVTDDFKTAKDMSIVNRIINTDKKIGFSLLIFENSINNLPSKFNNFIDINDDFCGVFGRTIDKNNQMKFKMNYLPDIDMRDFTSRLANIPVYGRDINTSIPSSLTFLDMYMVGRVDQLNILSRWKNNDPTISLKAPIGVKEKGKIIDLDLHEKFHGPHGLIAGSTGSGKSEFIITYILSMAVNYHPYEVQFILIDYKGGGLALAFENRETGIKIPHLVGTITNLDVSEMNRTLVSLKSELQRRQRIFNETRNNLGESTVDIYKYQKFYREGKVSEPMSHLFVISDEFAELKDQQPDFMDELISTARIGRSLGVHLILATQKPSGVVNEQIWSNTRFRVCLRVQGDEDSVEMLKRTDASTIKETGRFYLQVGNDEIFELGQSGWAGALYNPVDKITKKVDDNLDFIDNCGNVIKVINDNIKKNDANNYGEQLTNIVKYLYDIANREKIKFNSLWLPSLPNEIYYGNLVKKYNFKGNCEKFDVIMGEFDQPSQQMQGLYKMDLVSNNTVIFGLPGCGKDNLLTTIIFSACISYTPWDIEFYILDFGAQVLKCFDNMPHVGDVIFADETDKILGVFSKAETELKKRKNLFSDYDGTFSSYVDNSGSRVPLMVVVLNAYESFRENCPDEYDEYLGHLLREGSKYGIIFIVSTVATNSIRGSMLDCFSSKIMLQVQDPFDYEFIIGASHGLVPKKNFGRGIALIPDIDDVCEFQSCLINKKNEVSSYVKQTGKYLLDNYNYRVPEIRFLPTSVSYNDMYKYLKSVDAIPIGYTRDDVDVYYYNFIKNKCSFILGEKITDNVTFFGGILDLMDNIKRINMAIIDFINCIDFEGTATLYQSNFEDIFDDIITDDGNGSINIYFIIGIGNVENILNETEFNKFNNIMMQINNFSSSYFVFIDDVSRFNNIRSNDWYDLLDLTSVIWSGSGIEKQNIFKINDLNNDDRNVDFSDVAYVVDNGEYQVLKVIGDGEEMSNSDDDNDDNFLGGFLNG